MAFEILIVEDDIDSYELYSDFLASCGYSVSGADNGVAAVEAALRSRPALIVMDAVLPGRSGFEAARLLKSDPRTGHIPILAITGLVQRRFLDEARAAGCDGVLGKPFPLDALAAEVQRLLGREGAHVSAAR
ncbi:MAG TPA: response regulator [Polyangia bacterium]|nr:response regulator [Polyangia bacterium]